MIGRSIGRAARGTGQFQAAAKAPTGTRALRIGASSNLEGPLEGDILSKTLDATDPADARFEVIGAPYSLLSASLSASQTLYTRRGTLVGVSGKAENAQSTLSILEPFRRAPLGIPFLYQKISSTSPIKALISTKSPITSMEVLHLDGREDWMIAQRNALLAWTGHRLNVSPTINRSLSIAHWGNTQITGRGLVALAGAGRIYEVTLKAGEEFVAHPGNVLAYTMTSQHPPKPYRFKASILKLQVPTLGFSKLLPDIKFFRVMQQTDSWQLVKKLFFALRTTMRRTIWGDRLFLQFQGPTTILMSTRASRVSDVLTSREINEIADAPPGAVLEAVEAAGKPKQISSPTQRTDVPTGFHVAEVSKEGKVKFEDSAAKSVVR
ncbi:Altered inheritance of mitochondria mitochondrial protein [Rutstroemia sp. NJR-2017a WRK4]|nr:Altered inheritance of mitochondria mitochondrial protein [Rutstroemia sp. NJR-2017a WRK4]